MFPDSSYSPDLVFAMETKGRAPPVHQLLIVVPAFVETITVSGTVWVSSQAWRFFFTKGVSAEL